MIATLIGVTTGGEIGGNVDYGQLMRQQLVVLRRRSPEAATTAETSTGYCLYGPRLVIRVFVWQLPIF
jgi:hypothetical protein